MIPCVCACRARLLTLCDQSGAYFASQTFLEKAEVSERVMQVLKNFEKVEDAKVAAGAHFEKDLGLDSLDAVEVCMALEEEFCIQIPDAEAESIKTVEDAVAFVSTHPQAK